MEAEATEMRDRNREYLRPLDEIFEGIFQMEDLPTEVFQKMTGASEILSLMKRRLR